MTNDWRVYVFETTSGRVISQLEFDGVPSWTVGLNDQGGGGVSVPLSTLAKVDIDQWTQPWRWSYAVVFNNFALQAGPVINESYTDGQLSTSVTFAGLWKIFGSRALLNTGGSNPAVTAQDTNYANLTLRQIAKNIVVTNETLTGNNLPINYPADDAAGINTRTYFGYDLNTVADMLANLTTVDQGPEIEFRPVYAPATNSFSWTMRIGAPRLGQIGSPWVWDYGRRGALMSLDFQRDGSSMVSTSYVKGSGSQYAQMYGVHQDMTLVNEGYPNLDGVDGNHTDATVQTTLDSYALSNVNTYRNPLNTYTATVKADGTDTNGQPTGSPDITQISVGDTAQFCVMDHRRIPDGTYTHRIVGIQSNDMQSVKLILQPTYGAS